jgi:hypothetical protein
MATGRMDGLDDAGSNSRPSPFSSKTGHGATGNYGLAWVRAGWQDFFCLRFIPQWADMALSKQLLFRFLVSGVIGQVKEQ